MPHLLAHFQSATGWDTSWTAALAVGAAERLIQVNKRISLVAYFCLLFGHLARTPSEVGQHWAAGRSCPSASPTETNCDTYTSFGSIFHCLMPPLLVLFPKSSLYLKYNRPWSAYKNSNCDLNRGLLKILFSSPALNAHDMPSNTTTVFNTTSGECIPSRHWNYNKSVSVNDKTWAHQIAPSIPSVTLFFIILSRTNLILVKAPSLRSLNVNPNFSK